MVISKISEKDGKKFIEYLGKPHLFYGVQARMDEAEDVDASDAALEKNFEFARKLGFSDISVPLRWRKFEKTDGVYDCSFLKKYICWADKYGLALQILWFGSNVCGGQKSIPEFIRNDAEKYPHTDGGKFIDLKNKAFFDKEKAAFLKMLECITENDKNRRTYVIQVENEPDYGAGWQGQYRECLRYINELGKLVKNSEYSVVTRVNITAADVLFENGVPEDICALDGIDIVGTDLYVKEEELYNKWLEKLQTGGLSDNLPHIAEGGGQLFNLTHLIANSFTKSAGYLVYEIRTVRENDYDFGILRLNPYEWEYRDGTNEVQYQWTKGVNVRENKTENVIEFNSSVNKLAPLLATARAGSINLSECGGEANAGNMNIKILSGGFCLTVSADSGSVYAFCGEKTAEIVFNRECLVENGAFEGEKWVEYSRCKASKVVFQAGQAYKITAEKRI